MPWLRTGSELVSWTQRCVLPARLTSPGWRMRRTRGSAACVRRLIDDRGLHLADHLADRLAILHLHVAAHDGIDRQPFDFPPAPRRRVVLAVQLVGIDRRLLVHVDDRQVAVGPNSDRAL